MGFDHTTTSGPGCRVGGTFSGGALSFPQEGVPVRQAGCGVGTGYPWTTTANSPARLLGFAIAVAVNLATDDFGYPGMVAALMVTAVLAARTPRWPR